MDLTTTYLGLQLKNPLVPSASPLSKQLHTIRQMEDAGAAAIVFFSLFEEQLQMDSMLLDHFFDYGSESVGEASSYFPEYYPTSQENEVRPESYLELLRQAKDAVDIPIIGSLNCISPEGWASCASQIEEAGADALELNIYDIPTDTQLSGKELEERYIEMIKQVKKAIDIPLAIKLHPFFSSIPNMAKKIAEAGASGLVLFNRFYQPDLDIENLEVVPHLVLSDSNDLQLPLRWISILYGKVDVDFALTSGVHNHVDVLKSMMAGANVSMMASELLHNGIGRISEILQELQRWMEEHEYESIEQMQGSMSHRNTSDPKAFERANYMKALQSFSIDPTGQSH